jgi:type I restriction-modification system DNA methylase subunit
MNENATRQGFIMPMFRALGWDIDNINEVSPEEKVSRGFVDFSFRIGGVPRYFLETKRADEDLTNPQWVRQAIDYAWTKSVTWALLSDFEGTIVFNAEAKTDNPFRSRFLDFDLDSYLPKFEQLWWLSREQTLAGRLDKEADKFGRINKRLPVSQELFGDLKKWRELLFNNFKLHNPMMPSGDVDNAILQLLNRLIFIRTAEDRQVEPIRLRAFVRELRDRKQFKNWGAELSRLFREMDGIYNSELFSEKRGSDGMELSPEVLEQVIEGLYQKHYILYNFNALESDVLGTVYEQYLGAVVADKSEEQAPFGKKAGKQAELIAEGMTVQERRQKRKSQGIYYTPSFVTKYIVQQTVGKYVEENGYNPSKPPRILDMACGSGSFLIEAFDVMDKFVMNMRHQTSRTSQTQTSEVLETSEVSDLFDRARQLEVLQNCIYGVDKDKQALEVARLNLLLRALHSSEKLPMLKNFHLGDSLRPETWEMGFPEVMKDGGFDIIIGNPPYVRPHNLPEETKQFLWDNYSTFVAKADLYTCFIERGIKLLKPNGVLAFIVSDGWLRLDSFREIRQHILKHCKVVELVNMPDKVFENATVKTSIFVFQKESNAMQIEDNIINVLDWRLGEILPTYTYKIQQSVFNSTPRNIFDTSLSSEVYGLKSKIEMASTPLSEITRIKFGLKTGDDEKFIHKKATTKKHKPLLRGENIHRYELKFAGEYVWYVPDEMRENKKTARPGESERFEQPKILVRDTGGNLECTLDTENYYVKDVLVLIKKENSGYSLAYIVGLLNSYLMRYYYETSFPTLHVQNSELAVLPIHRVNFNDPTEKAAHDEIVSLVEKMLSLQKERQSFTSKLYEDEIREVERKITHVDEEINQRVYRLYGLNEDEIKIVEGKS